MKSPSLVVCLVVLLLASVMAAPTFADQPDFDFKLTVTAPAGVGDPFDIRVTVTKLSPENVSVQYMVSAVGPDGQTDWESDLYGIGGSLPRIKETSTFQIRPKRNGEHVIRVLRQAGDARTIAAETRVTRDKAQPGLDRIPGQFRGLQLSAVDTAPAYPQPGQPVQVMVTLQNTNAFVTDAVVPVSIMWAGASGDEPVGHAFFQALQPGEERTVSFDWTPGRSVDGAEMDATVSGSLATRTWGRDASPSQGSGSGQQPEPDPLNTDGDAS